MDIEYKGKVELSIKNVDIRDLDSITKIVELFKSFDKTTIVSKQDNTLQKNTKEEKESDKSIVRDRMLVKDRIPNQIDLSELEIKKAVTKEPMIRCPHCGQSSVVFAKIENDNYLLRKENKNNKDTYKIVVSLDDEAVKGLYKPAQADIRDYHNDMMKIRVSSKFKDKDLNVNNDTDLTCPVCATTHKFKEWVDAFKDPLWFGFETELLCDVCGGEAVERIDENKNKFVKCEHCGYEKKIV